MNPLVTLKQYITIGDTRNALRQLEVCEAYVKSLEAKKSAYTALKRAVDPFVYETDKYWLDSDCLTTRIEVSEDEFRAMREDLYN